MKEDRQKKVNTECFRLHKTMENANQSVVTESRSVAWGMGWDPERSTELFVGVNMFIILIMVIIS